MTSAFSPVSLLLTAAFILALTAVHAAPSQTAHKAQLSLDDKPAHSGLPDPADLVEVRAAAAPSTPEMLIEGPTKTFEELGIKAGDIDMSNAEAMRRFIEDYNGMRRDHVRRSPQYAEKAKKFAERMHFGGDKTSVRNEHVGEELEEAVERESGAGHVAMRKVSGLERSRLAQRLAKEKNGDKALSGKAVGERKVLVPLKHDVRQVARTVPDESPDQALLAAASESADEFFGKYTKVELRDAANRRRAEYDQENETEALVGQVTYTIGSPKVDC